MIHILKCIQPYFDDVASGNKTFDLRKDDRNYQVGDRLDLFEGEEDIDPMSTAYRRHLHVWVKYKLELVGKHWGLPDDFCILGITMEPPGEPVLKAEPNYVLVVDVSDNGRLYYYTGIWSDKTTHKSYPGGLQVTSTPSKRVPVNTNDYTEAVKLVYEEEAKVLCAKLNEAQDHFTYHVEEHMYMDKTN